MLASALVMDHHAIPEHAIRCFERLHGLLVTVHDLDGSLAPFLLPERRRHRQAQCIAVQDSGHGHTCREFDIVRLRQELAWRPAGRIQRCPAGLVEWVMPLSGANGLRAVLFAGVVADHGLESLLTAAARPTIRTASAPPRCDPARADLVLESLTQLAARLAQWLRDEATAGAAGLGSHSPIAASLEQRRVTIRQFIHEHYGNPLVIGDLARHLGLSPSRTGAVVVETCGMPFTDLVLAARLASASDLLRHTALPVTDIGLRCGFTDQSTFFRAFRRAHGTTPLRWRAQQAAVPADGAI